MLSTDKSALVCDLAETYHIFDYKSYSALLIAELSVGLRADSRIKMKMNNVRHPLNELLLAALVDRMSLFIWMNSKDGFSGVNRPESILTQLLGDAEEKEVVAFDSPEDFQNEWDRIVKRGET